MDSWLVLYDEEEAEDGLFGFLFLRCGEVGFFSYFAATVCLSQCVFGLCEVCGLLGWDECGEEGFFFGLPPVDEEDSLRFRVRGMWSL